LDNYNYKEFFVQKQDENLTFKIFANKGTIKIMKVSIPLIKALEDNNESSRKHKGMMMFIHHQ